MTPLERHELELAASSASLLDPCPRCGASVDYRTLGALHRPIVDEIDEGVLICEGCRAWSVAAYWRAARARQDAAQTEPWPPRRQSSTRTLLARLGALPALEVVLVVILAAIAGMWMAERIGGAS